MAKNDPSTLTDKQKIFVLEYLIDLNATQAAIRAGYSEKSARCIASENMDNPKIQAEIQRQMDARVEKTGISGEKVLKRLDAIGDVDPADAVDDDNCWLPVKKMPVHVRKSIASVKIFEKWDYVDDPESGNRVKIKIGEVIEVKFCDKVKSNELIGKNQKLFTDRVEVENKNPERNMSDAELDAKIEQKMKALKA